MNPLFARLTAAGRITVILAWAVFLVFAWSTRRLEVINPSFRWLSLASAGALLCIAAAQAAAMRRQRGEAPHEHAHDHHGEHCVACCAHEAPSSREWIAQALFLCPIVLSLCTGPGTLSGKSIARRGIQEVRAPAAVAPLPGVTTTTVAGSEEPALPDGPPLSMDDLYQRQIMGMGAELEGQPAILLGQHFRDERCGDNEFVLVRLVVSCCLADAETLGVRIRPRKPFDPGSEKPPQISRPDWETEMGGRGVLMRLNELGPWLLVSGELRWRNDRMGRRSLYVENATVQAHPAPSEALLYPRSGGFW